MKPQQQPVKRALILSGGGARGAYQVGVWQRLQEAGWEPDLICGTSIGSINGALIGQGWSAGQMEEFWEKLHRKKVFRVSLWCRIKYNFARLFGRDHSWPSLLDNRPLRKLLSSVVDEQRLRQAAPEVVVTATNVRRAELEYFSSAELTVEHILASCALPIFFPWGEIDGELYWDGGIMSNTPVLPAVQHRAQEIVVVLLAPLTGRPVPPPKNIREAIAWTLDMITIASAKTLRNYLSQQLGVDPTQAADAISDNHFIELGGVKIGIVAPRSSFGLDSILDLDPEEAKDRIADGYADASQQLGHFFEAIDKTAGPSNP